MAHVRPTRSVGALLVAAVAATAVAVAVPPAAGAAPATPCGPLGDLVELELNDRCDYGAKDPSDVDTAAIVAGLSASGLFATILTCADGPAVPVVARPNQLIVAADDRGQLQEALATVRQRLAGAFRSSEVLNGLAAVVRVRRGTIDETFLRSTVPTLQGPTWSTDLNYLEPAMPNNAFRPGGDPSEAIAPPIGSGGRGSVLVVDSPSQRRAHPVAPDVVTSTLGPSAVYDLDGNGLLDEDHGHGVFVASLIKRLAPDAAVTLAGVRGGRVPGLDRWSPMLFSDADLISTLGSAFGLSPAGTVTRRGFDVINMSLGGAGCDGVAARLALGRFVRDLGDAAGTFGRPSIVAAAGNDGGEVRHYPAAFRDEKTMELAAVAVEDTGDVGSADAIRQLHADLLLDVVAVGSWTGGVRDAFSNCGEWINAIADGDEEVSRYPSPTTWAAWSGTSFATPKVAADLVFGLGLTDVVRGDGVGPC